MRPTWLRNFLSPVPLVHTFINARIFPILEMPLNDLAVACFCLVAYLIFTNKHLALVATIYLSTLVSCVMWLLTLLLCRSYSPKKALPITGSKQQLPPSLLHPSEKSSSLALQILYLLPNWPSRTYCPLWMSGPALPCMALSHTTIW